MDVGWESPLPVHVCDECAARMASDWTWWEETVQAFREVLLPKAN